MNCRKLVFTLMASIVLTTTHAQKTWGDIYTILSTKCSSPACHGSGSANDEFNVDTTSSVLYSQLLNANPNNPYARDSVLNKFITPNSPQTSYLFRKIAHCDTSSSFALTQPFEGAGMPVIGGQMPDAEIELIYNWIIQGASETAAISPDTVAGNVCNLPPVGVENFSGIIASISAYPNPAADNFSLSYSLNQPSLVTVDLLDLAGKKMKTIFTENHATGSHIATIAIAPEMKGVYLVRLTAGAAQHIRKVALY